MSYNQNLHDLLEKPDGYYTQTRPEMLEYIPSDCKKILDVGCGSGVFGQQLKQKSHVEVWGIELDHDIAGIAKEKIDKVLVGDVFDMIDKLPDAFFDCIVFNDVLEHLVDPFTVLSNIKSKLTKNGIIVCSIPNVRFFFTLKDLLIKKQWKYEDAGILDKTHLRFFTQKSIADTLDSLEYDIIKIDGINAIKSWKFTLLNILFFGQLLDTKYLQFACVAKPK